MDISHFELLFKPQSPVPPAATVVQGYFLEITNLEDEEFHFAVNLIAPEPDPATPNAIFRSLAGNTVVFVDVPSADNSAGVLSGSNKVYFPSTGPIRIPPEATALVAVLPSVFPLPQLDPTPIEIPVFEARGFVRLRLPPIFVVSVSDSQILEIRYGPQSSTPVRVMVTAQNRTTYFDASGAITDQTQASVPICEGKACIEIEPEGLPTVGPIQGRTSQSRSLVEELILRDDMSQLAPELAQMIAALDPDTTDLKSFNVGLKKAKIPFALKRRKV